MKWAGLMPSLILLARRFVLIIWGLKRSLLHPSLWEEDLFPAAMEPFRCRLLQLLVYLKVFLFMAHKFPMNWLPQPERQSCTLAESFGEMPEMIVEKIGYGAGKREIESDPNLLRIIIGTASRYTGQKISPNIKRIRLWCWKHVLTI